jgi:ectoine hydroxylase-related dioxygenase (phytanoyl-CoA dioxygenase family)
MNDNKLRALSEEQLAFFRTEGYLIVKGLLSQAEVDELQELFMDMHRKGPIPGHFHPVSEEEANNDILKVYPRIMHPHRFNRTAFHYMLHPRVMDVLEDLLGEEALAAQSMFYFKPPGAKGQALHQDNFYLKIEPGTCIAAWTAVDPSDPENGGLHVVPKSQELEVMCPHEADPQQSFTREEVDVPEGLEPVPAILDRGDVLFFNGNVIHGSYPNRSKDRFRRSFICHYGPLSETQKIAQFYQPLFTRDGRKHEVDINASGGPCGTEFADASAPH